MKLHHAQPIGYGATAYEIMEMLEIVSTLGIHGATVAVPLLEEAWAASGAMKRARPRTLSYHAGSGAARDGVGARTRITPRSAGSAASLRSYDAAARAIDVDDKHERQGDDPMGMIGRKRLRDAALREP